MFVSVITIKILLLASAAWGDVINRTISNRSCLVLALVGMLGQILVGPLALATSTAIAAGVFLVLLLLHNFKVLGGGDVKLLVAMALGLPPIGVVSLFTATALAGGVLCLLHLLMRRLPLPRLAKANASVFRRVYAVERWRVIRHAALPYGVAIACGGIWTILSTIGV